jgi:hypothetical protein
MDAGQWLDLLGCVKSKTTSSLAKLPPMVKT